MVLQQEGHGYFPAYKALLQGHFVLRSGLHSGMFFHARGLPECLAVERLGALHVQKLAGLSSTRLCARNGRLVIGQEVARRRRALSFAEKEKQRARHAPRFHSRAQARKSRRRGCITRGGRVQECFEI